MCSICKSLKKGLVLGALLLFSLFVTEGAYAQFTAGGGLAFQVGGFDALGIQAGGVYVLNADQGIRLAADLIYYFPGDAGPFNQSLFSINANGHYIFTTTESLVAYALAGLNFSFYDFDTGLGGIIDVDTSASDVALNAGAGVESEVGFGILYGEVKLVLGGFSDFVVSGGVRFPIGGN